MNELERVKERAKEVTLSLEAQEAIGRRPKAPGRPLSQMLNEWSDKPAKASTELRKQFGAAE